MHTPARRIARRLPTAALALSLLAQTACAHHDITLDRATLVPSEAARVSARNLVPDAARYPEVADQLAHAQAVYQHQRARLETRRDTLRSRKRSMGMLAFGALATTALGVGASAIYASPDDADAALQYGGTAALGGLAVGSSLQLAANAQEDPSAVDAKIQHLDQLYASMLQSLRQTSLNTAACASNPNAAPASNPSSQMGATIETFITSALAIHVKG